MNFAGTSPSKGHFSTVIAVELEAFYEILVSFRRYELIIDRKKFGTFLQSVHLIFSKKDFSDRLCLLQSAES